MRKLIGAVTVLLVFSSSGWAQGLKEGDRQGLLAHLDMTEAWLVSELDALSADLLSFHMTLESWSILEVVEHLVIAEPQYWQQALNSMKQPPAGKKPEATDAGILWYGIDRTNRQKTGEARVPNGRLPDMRSSLAEFRKLRKTIREYAATTTEDPRSRMLLEGNMDVYQWLLMISTHSQRHILQIREIKANASYPRQR
jgi:hypothetical protein